MTRRWAVGRLHVITDETVQERFTHEELARLCARAGADCIQFREKRAWTTRRRVETARRMVEVARETGARVVVDDRVDVAVASGASAVHLGRDDLDVETARVILGPAGLIGGTANSLDEALAVSHRPVDYLGVGPVFGTRSKANPAPVLGLEGLAEIVRRVDKPVVAIGNITAERVGEVLAAGAHGVAVLSAVVAARDPGEATARVREAMGVRVKA